jgi:hypothetical protein
MNRCPRCASERIERYSLTGAERCGECYLPRPVFVRRQRLSINWFALMVTIAASIILAAVVLR